MACLILFPWEVLMTVVYIATKPDNKVHGANLGPTWVLSAPDGPHVGPMKLAIRECKDLLTFSTVVLACIIWLLFLCAILSKKLFSSSSSWFVELFVCVHHHLGGFIWVIYPYPSVSQGDLTGIMQITSKWALVIDTFSTEQSFVCLLPGVWLLSLISTSCFQHSTE